MALKNDFVFDIYSKGFKDGTVNSGLYVSENGLKLELSDTLTNTVDAQYAGETVEEEVEGETVKTIVNNNVLQIKEDGLYLDSSWDCGEY